MPFGGPTMAVKFTKRPAPASSRRKPEDELSRFLSSPVSRLAEEELKGFAVTSSEMYETVVQQNSALLDQLEARIKLSNELVDEGFEEAATADESAIEQLGKVSFSRGANEIGRSRKR
jgi:hypothetical protein